MERNWCARGQVVASSVLTWLLLSLVIVSPAEGQTPSNLQAVANGDSAIDLSWTAPTLEFGESIEGYKIESTPDTTMDWTVLRENTSSTQTMDRPCSEHRLNRYQVPPSGTFTRHYRVSAINAEGTGRVSNVASTRTGAGVPGAPSGLVAARKGQSQIDLIWTAPSDDGGSEVTGYRIEFSKNGGQSWLVLVNNTASVATTYSDTGLSPGTSRHYRVSAINAEGTGPASEEARAITAAALPEAPTELTAIARGPSWIELSWEAPTYAGGVPIQGYKIEVHEDESSLWIVLLANTRSTGTGLLPSSWLGPRQHTVLPGLGNQLGRCRAGVGCRSRNVPGLGNQPGRYGRAPSRTAVATTDATVPDPPTRLDASARDHSQIDLSWQTPAFDGGSRITGADGRGYEERGFRGLVQVALQGGKQGLSFKLMPVWGNATSRVQELWERGVSDTPGSSHANFVGGRLNTEIVYGLPSFDGTLYGRFNIVDGGHALIRHRDEVSSRPSPRPPRRGDAEPKRRGTRPPRLGTEGPLAVLAPMTETKGVRTKCEANAPTG